MIAVFSQYGSSMESQYSSSMTSAKRICCRQGDYAGIMLDVPHWNAAFPVCLKHGETQLCWSCWDHAGNSHTAFQHRCMQHGPSIFQLYVCWDAGRLQHNWSSSMQTALVIPWSCMLPWIVLKIIESIDFLIRQLDLQMYDYLPLF